VLLYKKTYNLDIINKWYAVSCLWYLVCPNLLRSNVFKAFRLLPPRHWLCCSKTSRRWILWLWILRLVRVCCAQIGFDACCVYCRGLLVCECVCVGGRLIHHSIVIFNLSQSFFDWVQIVSKPSSINLFDVGLFGSKEMLDLFLLKGVVGIWTCSVLTVCPCTTF